MIPVQAVNKISKRVRNGRTGEMYVPETARALALALEIARLSLGH